MPALHVTIHLGNAAAQHPTDIAAILTGLATRIAQGATDGNLHDTNGNHVGTYTTI